MPENSNDLINQIVGLSIAAKNLNDVTDAQSTQNGLMAAIRSLSDVLLPKKAEPAKTPGPADVDPPAGRLRRAVDKEALAALVTLLQASGVEVEVVVL
jgi:hypothetical protein